MMVKNYEESVQINHIPNWPYIFDHLYRILKLVVQDQRKTNMFLNLLKHQQPDIEKIYFNFKDPLKSKYQSLINGREKVGIEILKNPKAIIVYSRTTNYV